MKAAFSIAALLIIGNVQAQYFQQDVAYNIRVELDDKNHILRGDEEVVYTNNSRDTLTFIYFHLWPNAYKNNKTALAKQLIRMGETKLFFATEDERGYIDSVSFALNGKLCLWEYDPEHIDICKIFLENPLLPQASVTISTPFKVKLPSGQISRLGHVGQSYQITQWYPKPAVYDTAGWHQMPYLTQGEFYSEFGSFDVYIDLPNNYVVGATGDLQNLDERKWLEEKVEETKVWINERKENDDWAEWKDKLEFPESSRDRKTLHYHQDRVHDFGWFADKRYHVLFGKVALPASGDSVEVWTMFTNKRASLWQNSIEYMQDAVYYYSLWNGDYPYHHATAVDGTIAAGGGMEYPNVTIIGDAGDALTLETVIMHEVGHNWFYGILGSNERDFPWLDEGVNSYNEQRYLSTKYPNGTILNKEDEPNKLLRFAGLDKYGIEDQHELTYLIQARANRDQPMNEHAQDYSLLNYGFIVYSKSAVSLNYLRHYLGDSIMDAGMHRYFEENKFKHPYPKSLENTIEQTSDENLDWFFTDIVKTREKIDYSIRSVKEVGNETKIKLSNRGLATPVMVSLMDKSDAVVHEVWVKGFESDTTIILQGLGHRVEIDRKQIMPELIRDNNYAKTHGIFKKTEPIKFKFLGAVEQPKVNQVFFAPVLGMNVPNGAMPGLMLYNHSLPSRKLSYVLIPMFGLKGSNLVGTGLVSYSVNPNYGLLETIEFGLGAKRYVYDRVLGQELKYNRFHPNITFYIKPTNYSGIVHQKFAFGSIINLLETPQKDAAGNWENQLTADLFNRVEYQIKLDHPVYATKLFARFEEHSDFVRTHFEANELIDFNGKLKLSLRYFAGAFLSNNSTNPAYNWRLDGQNAQTDYAFDGEFFDRSGADDFLGRQFSENHGGFKVPTAVGQSSTWLTSINVKAKIGRTPFGIFGDVGVSASDPFIYDAGVYVAIVPDMIEVYLPLLYSPSIQTEITTNGLEWYDLIRFQIAFDKLNLFEKIKRVDIP
jgi:hypothetical protein